MPKCRTGCLVLHVVRIFGVWRIPPAVIEAEVEFKWILKQTCFSRSEFFKEQTRQSKLWSIPGVLVVFLMFSAVKRFQGYWFFFFNSFFWPLTHFICHYEPSSPRGNYLWEYAFPDHSQPNQCNPQQVHRGKAVKVSSFFPYMLIVSVGAQNSHSSHLLLNALAMLHVTWSLRHFYL